MNRPRVWLRADASAEIGCGHFTRMLALAELLGNDFSVCFAVCNPTESQRLSVEGLGFDLVALGDDHFDHFLKKVHRNHIVVLDNYFFDEAYSRRLKAHGAKVVLVDDILPQDRPWADAVLNQGLEWALLRPPFLASHHTEREPGRVAVCFGGVDAHGYGERCRDFFEGQGHSVELIRGLSAEKVAQAFARAEWAVVSASGAMIEALATGAKVAAGWYVDNQRNLYETFADKGYVAPLGDLRQGNLNEKLARLRNPPYRPVVDWSAIARRYRRLFVGLALRYQDYRELSIDQHRLLWAERNRAEIREQMDYPMPFDFEVHQRFIAALKMQPVPRYWAVWFGDRLVGNINLSDADKKTQEVGIFVVPEFWGTGASEAMEHFAAEHTQAKYLKARVRRTNLRSKVYFEKLGYRLVDQTADHDVLRRKIK